MRQCNERPRNGMGITPNIGKRPDEAAMETTVEIISVRMRKEGSEDTRVSDGSEKQSDSNTPVEIPNSNEETKPRRSAATRAFEKIKSGRATS